jgi:acyl-CoA synthetase (NDP forming)
VSKNSLNFLFNPESVAVLGASTNPSSFGCDMMKHILDYGFKGRVYPVNSRQSEIFGLKAYPDILQIPGTVDYAICCIGVNNVPALLEQCRQKGVKAIHILAGRSAETGRAEAREMEAEVLKKAREYGIRLIGPNCLGVFCPTTGLAFGYDFPSQPGGVGALIQSGGNSTELIHIGSPRGVRFSKVVSYGNALDLNQNDLLEYFLDDPETKVVVGYIEGLKGDPREFLDLVRAVARKKPIILCKGGRTNAGARLTATHTATLAGSGRIWETAIRQMGAIPARHIDDLVNMAVAFSMLPPVKGRKVGIVGCGGGRSILSADCWAENGFEVPSLPEPIRQEFKRRGSQIWDWIGNPADVSIMIPGDSFTMEAMAAEMAKSPAFDLIAADAEEDPPFDKEHFIQEISDDCEAYIKIKSEFDKPLLVVFDERSPGTAENDSWNYQVRARLRTRLVEEKVPFFPSVDEAARAVNEHIKYYARKEETAGL